MSLSPYARDLVRKAGADAPSTERRELARRRFVEASTAAAAGAAVTAAAGSAGKSGAATLASAKVLFVAKIVAAVAVAVVGAAVVVGTQRQSEVSPQPAPTTSVAPTAPTASAEVAPIPTVSEPELTPVMSSASTPVTPAPVASVASPKVAPSVPKAAPPAIAAAEPADPLVQEAQLLERARSCLAATDTACARERLREHELLPHPRLAAEAAVMNIEVLRAEGRPNEARQAATKFIEARPTSSYLKRVRAILRQLEQEQEKR